MDWGLLANKSWIDIARRRQILTVKLNIVREHLMRYYKYNEEEIEELTIEETKITIKGYIYIYIAVAHINDIRDIYRRKYEIKRDNLFLRNYVPPQFFTRFIRLGEICQQKRQEDSRLKTQIRFGKNDLEILTKEKGSDKPFNVVNLKDFIGDLEVPEFDWRMKWKSHVDRKPRRTVTDSSSPSPQNSPQNCQSRVTGQPVTGKE